MAFLCITFWWNLSDCSQISSVNSSIVCCINGHSNYILSIRLTTSQSLQGQWLFMGAFGWHGGQSVKVSDPSDLINSNNCNL